AQDGVVADDELRAVLGVEQHAIAARDAAALLQEPGERADLPIEARVAHRRIVVEDRRLVRIAARAHLEVVVDAGARDRQRFGNAGRPMGEMAIEEAHSSYFFTAFSFHFMPKPGRTGTTAQPR